MKLGKPLIPILNQNETSEIKISASTTYSIFYPWYMFDGKTDTNWDSYSDRTPTLTITFKNKTVSIQGLSIMRHAFARNETVEVYYWNLETNAYTLIETFDMVTGIQNIERLFQKSVKTDTVKLQFKTTSNDVQIKELQLHGIVGFNIIKMDNQYYTIKDNEVQTVSDFVESYDFFSSKGFTIDAMNLNVVQTLKNMGQSYSILTARGE